MKKLLFTLLAGAAVLCGCNKKDRAAEVPAPAGKHTEVKHPAWSRNAVIYEVNTRQYTPEGTFEAFRNHIPRLKDLGVDILWFMPIHPISEKNRKGELGSYYAVRDYKAVNPEFGTLDDFKATVDSAHAAGMKVIIDWVPNHTGCDHAWVEEHPEYYKLNDEGKMFGPADWTDVYQLDYSNKGTCEAMIDAMEYWLRETGIDGFRCDVAGMVPVKFWNKARKRLEKIKPDIFMLAEAAQPSLHEKAFDMAYNWPLIDLFGKIAKHTDSHAVAIDSLIASQANEYPADSYMMNMITNHDFNSWDGTEFERLGNLTDACAVLSYTLPGMPLIYTGQETGMDRRFAFFEKDKAPEWEPVNEHFVFYKTLNYLKHIRDELNAGTDGGKMTVYPTESDDVLVFSREKDGCTTLVGVNLGESAQELVFKDQTPDVEGFYNMMSAEIIDALPAIIGPGKYFLYVND